MTITTRPTADSWAGPTTTAHQLISPYLEGRTGIVRLPTQAELARRTARSPGTIRQLVDTLGPLVRHTIGGLWIDADLYHQTQPCRRAPNGSGHRTRPRLSPRPHPPSQHPTTPGASDADPSASLDEPTVTYCRQLLAAAASALHLGHHDDARHLVTLCQRALTASQNRRGPRHFASDNRRGPRHNDDARGTSDQEEDHLIWSPPPRAAQPASQPCDAASTPTEIDDALAELVDYCHHHGLPARLDDRGYATLARYTAEQITNEATNLTDTSRRRPGLITSPLHVLVANAIKHPDTFGTSPAPPLIPARPEPGTDGRPIPTPLDQARSFGATIARTAQLSDTDAIAEINAQYPTGSPEHTAALEHYTNLRATITKPA